MTDKDFLEVFKKDEHIVEYLGHEYRDKLAAAFEMYINREESEKKRR